MNMFLKILLGIVSWISYLTFLAAFILSIVKSAIDTKITWTEIIILGSIGPAFLTICGIFLLVLYFANSINKKIKIMQRRKIDNLVKKIDEINSEDKK